MPQKILITGSNGLLGQKLVNLFSQAQSFEVVALSRGANRNDTAKNYTYYALDITATNTLVDCIAKEKPDYIINCAAMTNVDQCEREKETCELINIEAVKVLVSLAKTQEIHLIHISTDFIFDGENGPYKEDAKPNPINYYGESKLKAETLIIDSGIDYTILRTILVFGLVDNMARNNIVLWVKESLEAKKEITIVDDQYRMPTFVDDLADACMLAIQHNAQGIFNVSTSELLSIYQMALQIAEAYHLDASYIKSISTSQLNQLAKRPAKTGFDLEKSQKVLKLPIASFKERLQVFKGRI